MVERVYEEEEEWTMKEDGKFVFITFVHEFREEHTL
jgi:hypothetical protein